MRVAESVVATCTDHVTLTATVYKAINIINNKAYAIKLELCAKGRSSVEREYHNLQQLQGGAGIPCAHWFGRELAYDALVLDLLGPSLYELLAQHKTFGLHTVSYLGGQLVSGHFDYCCRLKKSFWQVSCLQHIHSRGYVHCDIKPQNILMGLGDQAQTVFVIDFGIARQFRSSSTGAHVPFRQAHTLTGTPAFTSINSHLGAELGRRDDLESLAYMLIFFLHGSLPWLSFGRRNLTNSAILELKQKTPVESLCSGLPRELATILIYTRTLSFSETPDYDYIRSLLVHLRSENHSAQLPQHLEHLPPSPACRAVESPLPKRRSGAAGTSNNRETPARA